MTPEERASAALNRLCKFRSVFTGWFLGSRPDTDGPTRAYRDAVDARLILRTEVSALTALLVRKGVFTVDEMNNQVAVEADHLIAALQAKFDGFTATDAGLSMNPKRAQETMHRMGFPP